MGGIGHESSRKLFRFVTLDALRGFGVIFNGLLGDLFRCTKELGIMAINLRIDSVIGRFLRKLHMNGFGRRESFFPKIKQHVQNVCVFVSVEFGGIELHIEFDNFHHPIVDR